MSNTSNNSTEREWRRKAEQSDRHEWCEDCGMSFYEHFSECPHCRHNDSEAEA